MSGGCFGQRLEGVWRFQHIKCNTTTTFFKTSSRDKSTWDKVKSGQVKLGQVKLGPVKSGQVES